MGAKSPFGSPPSTVNPSSKRLYNWRQTVQQCRAIRFAISCWPNCTLWRSNPWASLDAQRTCSPHSSRFPECLCPCRQRAFRISPLGAGTDCSVKQRADASPSTGFDHRCRPHRCHTWSTWGRSRRSSNRCGGNTGSAISELRRNTSVDSCNVTSGDRHYDTPNSWHTTGRSRAKRPPILTPGAGGLASFGRWRPNRPAIGWWARLAAPALCYAEPGTTCPGLTCPHRHGHRELKCWSDHDPNPGGDVATGEHGEFTAGHPRHAGGDLPICATSRFSRSNRSPNCRRHAALCSWRSTLDGPHRSVASAATL